MANDFLELAGSLPFIDEIYAQYLQNPLSVDESWRRVFDSQPRVEVRGSNGHDNGHENGQQLRAAPLAAPPISPGDIGVGRIYGLVNAYRVRGHLEAQLD